MTLRNWTRVEDYEGENLNDYIPQAEKVFFNYETGLYCIVGKREGDWNVYVGWEDSGIGLPFEEDGSDAPLPPSPIDPLTGHNNKKDAISRAHEYRKNNRAKVPRQDEYSDRSTLYDIARDEMVDKEYFARFVEIRFPRETDRNYLREWARRILRGSAESAADSKSLKALKEAKE